MTIPPEALEAFAADLAAAADERGVVLTPADVQAVLSTTLATGTFNPMGTRAALDDLASAGGSANDSGGESWDVGADEFDFADDDDAEEEDVLPGNDLFRTHLNHDLSKLQERVGRPLKESELHYLAGRAIEDAGRHDRIDLDQAWNERQKQLSTHEGRSQLYRERLTELDSGPARDETRELNLDDAQDRREFMHARLSGEEFEDA